MLVHINKTTKSQWHEKTVHFHIQGTAAKVGMKLGDILSDPPEDDFELSKITLTIMEDPEAL